MLDLSKALDLMSQLGCEYGDVRLVTTEGEYLAVDGTEGFSCQNERKAGLNVRVLLGRSWGFASTTTIDEDSLVQTVRSAAAMARLSRYQREVVLSPEPAVKAEYVTPWRTDPFAVPKQDKLNLLAQANSLALAVEGVEQASSNASFHRETIHFVSSEGSDIEQVIYWGGGGLRAIAEGAGMVQQRSYPYRGQAGHGQNFRTGGYEILLDMDLPGNAQRIGAQAHWCAGCGAAHRKRVRPQDHERYFGPVHGCHADSRVGRPSG